MSNSLWPHDCSMPGFPVHHQLLEPTQTHVHHVGDAIQPSHPLSPFSSRLQSFPGSGFFPMCQLFPSDGQSTGVSASASVLPMNIQDWFPLGWTVGSPCNPRDSQASSPTPQFNSINSLVLSFLQGTQQWFWSPQNKVCHPIWSRCHDLSVPQNVTVDPCLLC